MPEPLQYYHHSDVSGWAQMLVRILLPTSCFKMPCTSTMIALHVVAIVITIMVAIAITAAIAIAIAIAIATNIPVVMKTIVRVRPVGSARCLLRQVRVIDRQCSRAKVQGFLRGQADTLAEFQKTLVVLPRAQDRRRSLPGQFLQPDPGVSVSGRVVLVRRVLVAPRIDKDSRWEGVHEEPALVLCEDALQCVAQRIRFVVAGIVVAVF